jgi:hypothetical protein
LITSKVRGTCTENRVKQLGAGAAIPEGEWGI